MYLAYLSLKEKILSSDEISISRKIDREVISEGLGSRSHIAGPCVSCPKVWKLELKQSGLLRFPSGHTPFLLGLHVACLSDYRRVHTWTVVSSSGDLGGVDIRVRPWRWALPKLRETLKFFLFSCHFNSEFVRKRECASGGDGRR